MQANPNLIITLKKTGAEQSAKAAIKGGLAFGDTHLTLDCEAGTDGVLQV